MELLRFNRTYNWDFSCFYYRTLVFRAITSNPYLNRIWERDTDFSLHIFDPQNTWRQDFAVCLTWKSLFQLLMLQFNMRVEVRRYFTDRSEGFSAHFHCYKLCKIVTTCIYLLWHCCVQRFLINLYHINGFNALALSKSAFNLYIHIRSSK